MNYKKASKEYVYNNNNYIYCPYEYKDKVKELGFMWDKNLKLWYIPNKLFTEEVYTKTREKRYPDSKTGKEYYFVNYMNANDISKRTNT